MDVGTSEEQLEKLASKGHKGPKKILEDRPVLDPFGSMVWNVFVRLDKARSSGPLQISDICSVLDMFEVTQMGDRLEALDILQEMDREMMKILKEQTDARTGSVNQRQ